MTGGWRVLAGVLLFAGAALPAQASPVSACGAWEFVELPVPSAVHSGGVTSAAGSFAVANGSLRAVDGTTVLVWKDGQLVDQLSFFRNVTVARDVNSSGVVVLSAYTFPAASRWHNGVYESLQGLPGEHRVEAVAVNERGDVLGRSDGKPVVWPAGSAVPQRVPGTDVSWEPVGIADDGSVLVSSASGAQWVRDTGVVPLGAAQVRAVHGSYAVGVLGSEVVRWDVSGAVSPEYRFAGDAVSVNSHGHVLSRFAGGTELWESPDRSYPVPGGASFASVTDEGDVYGGSDGFPVLLDCAEGRRS